MTSRRPIGVFDSGLGGLTVLKELRRALPSEDFVYLGDVARLPYGTKSAETVTRYAEQCLKFLLSHDVKHVVVACNTASSSALDSLRKLTAVPVDGVIEPGVTAGISATKVGRVLVLATPATVASGAYVKTFEALNPSLSVEQLSCPLFVPLAEEGWFDHDVTAQVIRRYLDRAVDATYDTVVLGCTHYPLLAPSFRRVLGSSVTLVHGAAHLAERLRTRFGQEEAGAGGTIRLFVTDAVASGLPIVESLFGERLPFETVDL